MLSSSQLVVGVDIGSHSVKVCQLKRADKAYSIVTLGSAILPEGAVDDGALVEPEVVAPAISNLFKNLKIKNKKVGISISGYSVIVKKVNLAVMSEKEMEDHIMTEAEQYIRDCAPDAKNFFTVILPGDPERPDWLQWIHYAETMASLIERQGTIIVIESLAAVAPLLGRTGYCASKHALHGLFTSLRAELIGSGVHIMIVCPGFVKTNLQARALGANGRVTRHPQSTVGRQDSPARVADAICQAM